MVGRSKGKVRFFLDGWGIITPDGGGLDLIIYPSSIKHEGSKKLEEGQIVEFTVSDLSSTRADDVTLCGSGGESFVSSEEKSRPRMKDNTFLDVFVNNSLAPKVVEISSSTSEEDGDDDEEDDEEEEECCILDFDPLQPLTIDFNEIVSVSDAHLSNLQDEDIFIIAERGKVACRDYPHARHLCVKYPFNETAHEDFCHQCHCYVCDSLAPCKYWKTSYGHCHAFDQEQKWKDLRIARRNQNGQDSYLLSDSSDYLS